MVLKTCIYERSQIIDGFLVATCYCNKQFLLRIKIKELIFELQAFSAMQHSSYDDGVLM